MAPSNKARAAGVSASSFFDLKAELAKKEEQFAKDKAGGKSASLVGGVRRPDKVRTYVSLHKFFTSKADYAFTEAYEMGKA